MIPPTQASTTQNKSTAKMSPLFSTPSTSNNQSSSPSQALSLDPFYSGNTFKRFIPFAGVYTLIAHLALLILKPFPFISRDFVTTVRPEDRFVLPSSIQKSAKEDMHNQHIAIVTGSNTGIGFETASSLVEIGYDVILACRSRDKGEHAVKAINERHMDKITKGNAIFLHPLDLSSLESVRGFVDCFTAKYQHLNILVNNAGINFSGKSVDGLDLCFQTNFVGHYLLTRLLIPQLLKAKNQFSSKDGGISGNGVEAGRVVNLSSVMHHFAKASEKRKNGVETYGVHDEKWWKGSSQPSTSRNVYAESKMAALLLTEELNERYGEQGLRAVSANPGAVNSDIWRNYPSYMMRIHDVIYLTSKQGSSTSFAASVGVLPKGAIYLQPYWQPWGRKPSSISNSNSSFARWFKLPVPFTEMLGLYIGHAITECRLPPKESSLAMWNVCEEIVGL